MIRLKHSMEAIAMLFMYCFLFSFPRICASALDMIVAGQSMKQNETLVSADGSFELGIFSPDGVENWYLGIWYKKISIKTVAWVANRDAPLSNSSTFLYFTNQGILELQNSDKGIVWSSNTSRTAKNPVVKLLESGNLLVSDGNDNNPENVLWQSFDYPGDTLLPEMKLGRNFKTGQEWILSSWKSTNDPAKGDFTCGIDTRGFPQLVIMKGSVMKCRGGPWNGLRFTGTPELKQNQVYGFKFVSNENEVYYQYELRNNSVVSRLALNESGILQRYYWIERTQIWRLFLSMEIDHCDDYALCGAYGSCNVENSIVCACLEGFMPKSPQDWNILDWSGGCVRRTQLDCENGDGFLKYSGVKLPDTSNSWFNTSMSLQECEQKCLINCSCTAYANSDIRDGGSGCLLWFGDLIDMREFSVGGQEIYVRMAAKELENIQKQRHSNGKKKVEIIVILLILVIAMLILGILLYIRKKRLLQKDMRKDDERMECNNEDVKEDTEFTTFDLTNIEIATENFSSYLKLGEGGFGPVYKGTLVDGKEIAVKRLSKSSGQGMTEFKNEVLLISKLQHRNLVQLLGCCIQGDEKMLIYEYLPNKSLDFFIFDQKRSRLLDWHKRFQIIGGIARGLLYLHHDSRLRIIHRDLKASNVLLDNDMNPKISDFGVAKTFVGDGKDASTTRVVGTFGYMSPEYAVDGVVSTKSDVYSFGVLVLEIVSGKRNRGFYHPEHQLNLLGHAWKLWIQQRPLELVDKFLLDSYSESEVLRCIHVGLLCVQQLPEDRPSMPSVVVMLNSESPLPQPKQPGFYTERNPLEPDSSTSMHSISSVNEITTTLLEAR